MINRDHVIARLKSQFATAQVVLFTGAGFSRDAKGRSGKPVPSVDELKQELWAICFDGDPFDPESTLGDLYAVALRKHRSALVRLLDERFVVDPASLPDHYRTYFSVPWRRVYTLNVDDLDAAVGRKFTLARPPAPLSATAIERAGAGDRSADTVVEVVHLNGIVGAEPERLTFSETQYAERLANVEPWYARCAADLRSRPVVFVGTELREETLWQHVELRRRQSPHSGATPPPGGVLVTPRLSAARREMLDAVNIDWFEGSAEAFAVDILGSFVEEINKGFAFLGGLDTGRRRRDVPLVSELAAERPDLATEFLLGDEPHWSDVIAGRVARRTSDAQLMEAARRILAGGAGRCVLGIGGTAGTGKSTALMSLALTLSNEGIPVFWIDKASAASPTQLRHQIAQLDGPVVVAIDDADMFGTQLGYFVRDTVPARSNMLVVFAARSGRLDELIAPIRRAELDVIEHIVPTLTDDDIDELLTVLERNHRLGILKGATAEARRQAFSSKAGRQLLVAMIEATSGERFEQKAQSELEQLEGIDRFVYGLVSVATSQRHHLYKDEVLLASTAQAGDAVDALQKLVRRHFVTAIPPRYEYRARHRVIADLVVERLQVNRQLKPLLNGIAFAAASKIDPSADRRDRSWRLLIRFISHSLLLQLLGLNDARDIYKDLENQLASDYHFWLQRGSLEVEAGDTRLAEHFLNQARSLNVEDHRIDTEFGYMLMRKAIERPADPKAAEWVESATQLLEGVIASRGGSDSHPFHILGSQGLAWSRRGSRTPIERRRLLGYYVNVVDQGLKRHPFQRDLIQLKTDLERELLLTATR